MAILGHLLVVLMRRLPDLVGICDQRTRPLPVQVDLLLAARLLRRPTRGVELDLALVLSRVVRDWRLQGQRLSLLAGERACVMVK